MTLPNGKRVAILFDLAGLAKQLVDYYNTLQRKAINNEVLTLAKGTITYNTQNQTFQIQNTYPSGS